MRSKNALWIVLWLLFLSPFAEAASDSTAEVHVEADKIEELPNYKQLDEIEQLLEEGRQKLLVMRRDLASTKDPDTKVIRESQIVQLEGQIRNQRQLFARIALDGVDVVRLFSESEKTADKTFKWQDELLVILRPLFAEMRRATEVPRKIELLRAEQLDLMQRLELIERGQKYLATIPRAQVKSKTKNRLEALDREMSNLQNDVQGKLDINKIQLADILEKQESLASQIGNGIKDFLLGRGFILLMALLSAAACIMAMQFALNLVLKTRAGKSTKKNDGFKVRLAVLLFRSLSVILGVACLILVLYASGDMVLLGLSLILLITVLIGLRHYVPRYVTEMQIFLNIGRVREYERVVYRGVPWRIQKLGFPSALSNPFLDNGYLRLPISELTTLISRPTVKEEPWFPCLPGEHVLLGDGTFGEITRQTPEWVYLKSFGSPLTIATAEFLQKSPKNLSQGFLVVQTFSVSHKHMADVESRIIPTFHQAIQDRIEASASAGQCEEISVEFKEVQGNALTFTILISMQGRAAPNFYRIGRVAQIACLESCRQNAWEIPFNQITVHEGDKKVPGQ